MTILSTHKIYEYVNFEETTFFLDFLSYLASEENKAVFL